MFSYPSKRLKQSILSTTIWWSVRSQAEQGGLPLLVKEGAQPSPRRLSYQNRQKAVYSGSAIVFLYLKPSDLIQVFGYWGKLVKHFVERVRSSRGFTKTYPRLALTMQIGIGISVETPLLTAKIALLPRYQRLSVGGWLVDCSSCLLPPPSFAERTAHLLLQVIFLGWYLKNVVTFSDMVRCLCRVWNPCRDSIAGGT